MALAAVAETDAWAVGRRGTIVRCNGREWRSEPSPTEGDLHTVALVSPTDGWITGAVGLVLRSRPLPSRP